MKLVLGNSSAQESFLEDTALWDEDDDGDGEDEVEAKISENKKKFKWKMLVKFK
ncbi:hypothetical protein CISIN_1g0465001mg, partial [Citrus sinensis]